MLVGLLHVHTLSTPSGWTVAFGCHGSREDGEIPGLS